MVALMCVRASVLFSVVGVPLYAVKPGDGLIPCSRRDLPGVEMMHCLKINAELEYVVTDEYDLRHGIDADLTFTLNWLLATIQRDVRTVPASVALMETPTIFSGLTESIQIKPGLLMRALIIGCSFVANTNVI
jgi:hypothetical protein